MKLLIAKYLSLLRISSLRNSELEYYVILTIQIEKISKFICNCLHSKYVSEKKKPESDSSENDKLNKEILKPITKSDSELEDELKELEVENSGGGKDGGGG